MNRPFDEPWQAEALATAMALQSAGVITPAEWSDALGAAIAAAEDDDYYRRVLEALETLLVAKGLLRGDELRERKHAWEAAYRRTPHGQPVTLA